MSGEKTEDPTDKKIEDAKLEGQSPKSQDVNVAVEMAGMLVAALTLGHLLYDGLAALATRALRQGLQVEGNDAMLAFMADQFWLALLLIVPVTILSVVLGFVAAVMQTGFMVSMQAIEPKMERLDPAEGLKRIFSMRSSVELGKTLIKAVALGSVIWVIVGDLLPALVGAAYLGPLNAGLIAWNALLKLTFAVTVVMIIIGPVDWGIQKWLFIRDQRMSKDDVEREHKENEGDPDLKQERKQRGREMVNSAPEQRVPGATVVVTNPTHYAVALLYKPGVTALPVVVAKGVDEAAARIRRLADANGVPIVGNPPLARALFLVRIDAFVPEPLFEAVATVLRWVAQIEAVKGKS